MGDMTSTRTHTRQIPVPGLMGMGFGGPGYGFRRVARVPEPARVGTAGWHVTCAIQAALNILRIMARCEGVARCRKVSRTLPWDASCRRWVRSNRKYIVIEVIKPRAGAAESGAEMGSIGRRWSETVVHACAQLETLHVRPFWSGTRCIRVVKAARECGMLGNTRNKQKSNLNVFEDRSRMERRGENLKG
ncbi:hypothetical protein EDB84DRAFT_1554607 [Lactarius hengduanensis]|nr:hypothetical protein EDB84DRAFT_1554607 [Lactarius hengduanensis]